MRTGFFIAGAGSVPIRLDSFMAEQMAPAYSRSQMARAIRAGLVRLNGRPGRASDRVGPGDRVELVAPPATPAAIEPRPESPMPIDILFADDSLIVVNKPPGMAVHPAPGHPNSTLVNALLCKFPDLGAMVEPDGVVRPGIVHRLDKDTSGVMVIARDALARNVLSAQFKQRSVKKLYLAVVRGWPRDDRFTVSRAVGRHPTERKRMSVHSYSAREALSVIRVIARTELECSGRNERISVVLVEPYTGRTHQIRVHLASVGHPCLGDALYGARQGAGFGIERQALHALRLTVDHPRSGERVGWIALPPPDLTSLLARARLGLSDGLLERWMGQT